MTRIKVYLAIQAALCVLLTVLLAASAVSIYREGEARKAEHPLEPIYTREIVAEKFAPIAPVFFAAIGLMIAGLALGAKDGEAEKPVKDAALSRNLIAARVAQPSDAMRRARKNQLLLLWAGWGAFAACMIPWVIYMLNPEHFPQEDLEGMFHGLVSVFLPWTAAGIGALAAASILREKCILREIEAAQARIREEKAAGVRPEPKETPQRRNVGALRLLLVITAIGLIAAGVFNGSARDVLYKAISICAECIGLG